MKNNLHSSDTELQMELEDIQSNYKHLEDVYNNLFSKLEVVSNDKNCLNHKKCEYNRSSRKFDRIRKKQTITAIFMTAIMFLITIPSINSSIMLFTSLGFCMGTSLITNYAAFSIRTKEERHFKNNNNIELIEKKIITKEKEESRLKNELATIRVDIRLYDRFFDSKKINLEKDTSINNISSSCCIKNSSNEQDYNYTYKLKK